MVLIRIVKLVTILVAIISITKSSVYGGEQRIVGGSAASDGEFPYQVSIRRSGEHVCGGVIISKNYILTAARCVVKTLGNDGIVSYHPDSFNVRVGSLSLYEKGTLMPVSEVLMHSNYNNMLHDLALLKLKEPIIYSDYIKSISLPYEMPNQASYVTVTGWGFHKTSGDFTRHLQYLEMAVVSPTNCFSYVFGEEADKALLCLQSTTGSGICTGDIGGVAVQNNELVGLASFNVEKCGSEYPDGFTNVSHYVQWIKDNTDIEF